MYIAVLKLMPPRLENRKIMRMLRTIHTLTRDSPGCLECSLLVDPETDQSVVSFERWQTQADLHRHLRSDLYRQVLELMELSVKAPEILFYKVTEDTEPDGPAEVPK